MAKEEVTRRRFLHKAGCSCMAATLGMYLTACSDDPVSMDNEDDPVPSSGVTIDGNTVTIDLTANNTARLANPGGFLLIAAASTAVINAGGEIKAFTSVCTHEQCHVSSFSNNRINCPCHGSQYDTNGQVVTGPAPDPLVEFLVTRNGDIVTITKPLR